MLVPPGEPVQIAEPVDTAIYVKGADGVKIKGDNKVTLPEGWWALPDPGPKK